MVPDNVSDDSSVQKNGHQIFFRDIAKYNDREKYLPNWFLTLTAQRTMI